MSVESTFLTVYAAWMDRARLYLWMTATANLKVSSLHGSILAIFFVNLSETLLVGKGT